MGHEFIFCPVCIQVFKSDSAKSNHQNQVGHWPCAKCNDLFKSEQSLYQHMDALGHWADNESSDSDQSDEDPEPQYEDVMASVMALWNQFRSS
jgi:uncharacterized C2H2 Zn-finger protein